ncbi:MAG: methyltransferase domain-containing protein [Pseudomonadota bacterium]
MTTAHYHPDLAGIYDRIAPNYDRLHRRWLRHAGGEAQAALEATVRAVATPGMDVLDAGCGTGAFARRLIREGQVQAQFTLLDPSEPMLAQCSDLPAVSIRGRLEAMPLPADHFHIVTCAWALETTVSMDDALSELARVVREGGMICLAFCAQTPARGTRERIMKAALTLRGTGRFLPVDRVTEMLEQRHGMDVRRLPCRGPAAALIARRS